MGDSQKVDAFKFFIKQQQKSKKNIFLRYKIVDISESSDRIEVIYLLDDESAKMIQR